MAIENSKPRDTTKENNQEDFVLLTARPDGMDFAEYKKIMRYQRDLWRHYKRHGNFTPVLKKKWIQRSTTRPGPTPTN